MPPGSGVPVPGAKRRVEHVDVDRDVQLVGLGQRLADGVGHHGLEAALPDLLHRVPRHALFEHPLERVLRRPVAAQADLHEVGAGDGAGLDQAAHRRAVAGQVAVDDVGGVGVGVEVDDADVAVAVHVGDGGGRRPGDRVVAAEDDRHDAARGDWCARARGCWRGDTSVWPCGQWASPKSTTSSQSKISRPRSMW